MQLILIWQRWVVSRIGQVYIRCSIGVLFRGDSIWCWLLPLALYNTSDTRGQSPSFGTTYQKTGKELMSRDELSVMDGSKCILQLRGVRPFLSDKFDITKHKRYKELSDFDKKNAFDVERYLKHEPRLRMDEQFDCYEVDVSEESTA